jgi:hypothetical protein
MATIKKMKKAQSGYNSAIKASAERLAERKSGSTSDKSARGFSKVTEERLKAQLSNPREIALYKEAMKQIPAERRVKTAEKWLKGRDREMEQVKKLYPKQKSGGKTMLKRADGSYSQRGLWDNIRAAKGSGKKPTAAMLKQEKKIKLTSKKK